MYKRISFLTILVVLSVQTIVHFEDAYSAKPMIIFDKPAYNPFATVKILIVDPASNVDRETNDVVRSVVHTKSSVGNLFEFREVAPNTGVFEALVTLTPNQNTWPADLVVQSNDELLVEFTSESGSSTSKIDIDFSISMVIYDKVQYTLDEVVKIFVLDVDENKDSTAIDTIDVMVWSTKDVKGLKMTLKEVSPNIGVFTGALSLTKDQPSFDAILQVGNSDIITTKYTDKTLLPISKQNESQAEVKDLLAAAIVAQRKTETMLEPPSVPEIVDRSGNPVSDVKLGKRIIIQDDLVNGYPTNQRFTYIVLIKDVDGITISLRYMMGELSPSSTVTAGVSWVPEEAGEYQVMTFLWQNIDKPVVLAPAKGLTVQVMDTYDSFSDV